MSDYKIDFRRINILLFPHRPALPIFGEKETSTIAEKIPQLALVGIKRLAKSVSPTYDWIYAR